MKRIDKPDELEIFEFDGVCAAGVYVGMLTQLKCVTHKLVWRQDDSFADEFSAGVNVLTLAEISEQLSRYGLITVIVNGPMSGAIYQSGNYSGADWYQIGELDGYA